MKRVDVETTKRTVVSSGKRPSASRSRSAWRLSAWFKAEVLSANGYLPPEILEQIFYYLPRRPSCHGFRRGVIPSECWSILRVCRSWHGPATRALYESIETRNFSATVKLLQTLEKDIQLSSYVRTIVLPTTGKRCPPQVTKVYLRILDELQLVDEVRVAIPFATTGGYLDEKMPSELIKHHGRLTALSLHRYSTHSSLFDPTLVQFPHQLRYLNLEGFHFGKNPFINPPPPLPYLHTVAFTYLESVQVLDEWLLTCPNLRGLCFHDMVLDDHLDPLKICTEGKITQLSLSLCRYWRIYLAEWLVVAFKNLQTLEIPMTMFAFYWTYLPLLLEELKLEVNQVELSPFVNMLSTYLERTVLKRLVLVVEPHHASFQENKERLLRLCSERFVAFEIDFLQCECKTRQEKAQDILIYPWRKVVRKYKELTDEDAIEIMDWEQPRSTEHEIVLLTL
ncbi:hypothetical protein FRC20_006332 [Serendipita sp. 405]|nr:hypothetical protein FRC18_006995 [Serendipita sp. 400]KAG8838388.1 hypothetical protein FRC20_006332 [Serendipita sp. 405]